MEDYKLSEQKHYSKLYSKGEENSRAIYRTSFLRESEATFQELIKFYCTDKRVLEIGCGLAKHGFLAANLNNEVVAIDITFEALRNVKSKIQENLKVGKLDVCLMDIEKLSFKDEVFDVVIEHEVFSSINLEKAFPELLRVLKPGGCIIGIETFGHNPIFNLKRKLNYLSGKRSKWVVSHILTTKDLDFINASTAKCKTQYFHIVSALLSPLAVLPIGWLMNSIVRFTEVVDRFLLKIPFLKKHAFKVVFCAFKV